MTWKIVAACLLLFCATYFFDVVRHPSPASLEDYSAFYCADRLIAAHANPYDERSIGRCEREVAPWRAGTAILAAPYPPYAMMLIYPLSLLPFAAAGGLWLAGIVAAIVLTCALAARVTGAPLVVAVAAFASAMFFPSMISASMEAYPVFGVVLAAYLLQRERWTYAAIALAASMIKPNLSLPVCIAAFAFLPQVRWRLFGTGAALFAAQTLFAGPRLFFTYLAYVATYARHDESNAWQCSLVYALHMMGPADRFASAAGWMQYAVTVAAGIAAGAFLARRFGDSAWIVLAPLAFAVVGGIYSRQQELAAAIPLGLALVYRAQSPLAKYALVLLATPWSAVYGDGAYPPFAMLATGTLVHQLWRPPRIVTVAAAFAAVAFLLSFPNGTTASNSAWFLRHLPGWLGLLAIAAACASTLVQARGTAAPQPSG